MRPSRNAGDAGETAFSECERLEGRIADLERQLDDARAEMGLVSNASKYSEPGGRVALSVKPADKVVTVAVRDWGDGIAARYHDEIFEKSAKIEASDSKTVPGTGLGLSLSICCAIIDRHGGEIGVDSKSGRGSTFYFKLPIAKAG
jgi:signal transduction histidine kinase